MKEIRRVSFVFLPSLKGMQILLLFSISIKLRKSRSVPVKIRRRGGGIFNILNSV